jgi:uncharacterized membrane protein YeaQ/YmgE (transglycosylase-associated protein family)
LVGDIVGDIVGARVGDAVGDIVGFNVGTRVLTHSYVIVNVVRGCVVGLSLPDTMCHSMSLSGR